jgi:type III restriction enzyme
MITVANRTETAARIKYAFDHKRIPVDELCVPELTVHIDSKTMDEAEGVVVEDIPVSSDDGSDSDNEDGVGERKLSKKEAAAVLRDTVDTVGQRGNRGEQISQRHIRRLLSEGWMPNGDAQSSGFALSPASCCASRWSGVACGARPMTSKMAAICSRGIREYFGIPFTFLRTNPTKLEFRNRRNPRRRLNRCPNGWICRSAFLTSSVLIASLSQR